MIFLGIYPKDAEKRKIVRRAVGYHIENGWKLFTQLLEKIHPAPSPRKAFYEPEDKHSFGPDVLSAYEDNIDTVTSARATLFQKLLLWALSEVKGIHRNKYNTIAESEYLKYFDSKMDTDHMEEFLSLLLNRGIETGYITYDDINKIAPLATKLAKLTEIYIPDEKTLELIGDEIEQTKDLNKILEKHPNKDQLYKIAEEIKQEFWKLHGNEIRQRLKGRKEKHTITHPAKNITKKEPALEDVAIESLKRMGIDLKLETGNVAERKSKIFSWLVNNGLIRIEEENGKPVVKATEELNRIAGKHGGKTAAAIIKWAAEEGVSKEHVEPVAKILGALEEFRQVAKKQDPALAKALEKAMKSKHTVKELYYLLQGEYLPEELSKRWSEKFGTRMDLIQMFERYPELAKATLNAMEEMERKGLAAPPVPKYWKRLLEKIRDGKVTKEDVEEYLAFSTYGKHVFNTLHSLAGEPLPKKGDEVEALVKNVLAHNRGVAEAVLARMGVSEGAKARGMEYLERNVEQLAQIVAHMKDPNHLERVEERLMPILERLPAQGRKIGLFRREKSPREKAEEFAGKVVEVIKRGARKEDLHELFRQAEELKEELAKHVGEKEADRFVRMVTAPAIAEMWKKRIDGTNPAEEYMKIVAQDNLHRFVGIEPKLKEVRQLLPVGERAKAIHDDLVRHLTTWELPGTVAEREPFARRQRTRGMLKAIVERHYR